MSSLNNTLLSGFDKYYRTITKLGYISKDSINKLIIASWINDIINGHYGILPDDEQYALLSNLYMCVEGDCLVPYQNYCRDFAINVLPNNEYVRTTETITYGTDRERLLDTYDNLRII